MMVDKVKLAVELPRVLVPLIGVSEEALPAEIGRLLTLELVRRGTLTFTKAAELLGVSQAEFIYYLGTHQISILGLAPGELRDEVGD